jgi:hypothetical protein
MVITVLQLIVLSLAPGGAIAMGVNYDTKGDNLLSCCWQRWRLSS